MGVWRTQQLKMCKTGHRNIQSVARRPRHHCDPARRTQISAGDRRHRVFGHHVRDARNRVRDCPIAGAATKIALHRFRERRELALIERRDRYDHSRCAKAALISLSVEESLLRRMERRRIAQSSNGRDDPSFRAKRRHQAGMHRYTVKQDTARTAVASVASPLHAKSSHIAKQGAQALPRLRRGLSILAVDDEPQGADNSSLISCARRCVRFRRQSGAPWISSSQAGTSTSIRASSSA